MGEELNGHKVDLNNFSFPHPSEEDTEVCDCGALAKWRCERFPPGTRAWEGCWRRDE